MHTRIQALTAIAALAILASLVASSPCRAEGPPPNIIVLFADDLGWNELPFFSPPVNQAGYADIFPEANKVNKGERALIRPAVNRLSARLYATRQGTSIGELGTFTGKLRSGVELSYMLEPIDATLAPPQYLVGGVDNDCASTAAMPICDSCTSNCDPCCEASTDVLDGFGGLKRLLDEGVVFPRFYANTSKCAPSRATLFTGRYPARTGAKDNGNELRTDEVTIAEFLKQGCTDLGGQTPPSNLCYNGASLFECPCYASDAECSAAFGRGACYHTGLIGKWHLGKTDENSPWSPWAQGFDEAFMFGGGARGYWKIDELQCSPASGRCIENPAIPCISTIECQLAGLQDTTCNLRALYVGTRQGVSPCSGDSTLPTGSRSCCDPKGARGKYDVKKRIVEGGDAAANGKDKRKNPVWPCGDTGLTTRTHCAYLTRVLRDQARNFIVRNADRQPYFLTVSFHSAHRAFQAPLRTESHYLTAQDPAVIPKLKAKAPNSASKYWGVIEELDSAVGQILDVLDHTGVCENDPSKGCTLDSQCADTCVSGKCQDPEFGTCQSNDDCSRCDVQAGTCFRDRAITCTADSECAPKCIPIGRCSISGAACLADCDAGQGDCQAQSKSTYVFFTSDHGSSKSNRTYGEPDLRGGKGDLFEGGARVGMLVRGPSSPVHQCINKNTGDPGVGCDPNDPNACACDAANPCTDPEVCTIVMQTPALGSIVDVFATAAAIAEYDTSPPFVRKQVGLCSQICDASNPCPAGQDCGSQGYCLTSSGQSCTGNEDCQTGEVCARDDVVIDGRSLLDAIKVPDARGVDQARDLSYASYSGAGSAVISREGQFSGSDAGGVCAYDSRIQGPSDARAIYGASCATCSDNADCVDNPLVQARVCKLAGKVCVKTGPEPDGDADPGNCPTTQFGIEQPPLDLDDGGDRCLSDTFVPNTSSAEPPVREGLYRCDTDSDCPPDLGLTCERNVWIPCNVCVPAAWKLKANAAGETVTELFDLTSNPGEEERLNFATCKSENPTDGSAQTPPGTPDVSAALQNGLEGWLGCVADDACLTPY